jgi:phosphotransferase system enzyme I (PtsI)
MAADVLLTPALVGLGVDELSTGAAVIPRVKRAIQTLNYEEARQLVARCIQSDSAETNQADLLQMARRLYPEIL